MRKISVLLLCTFLGSGCSGDRSNIASDHQEIDESLELEIPTEDLVIVPSPDEDNDVEEGPEGDETIVSEDIHIDIAGRFLDDTGTPTGETLHKAPLMNAFWMAWSVYFPSSEIWGAESLSAVRDAPLADDMNGRPGCAGGFDCIPSLPSPRSPDEPLNWVGTNDDGADYLSETDLIIGMEIDGEARAYPHNLLWWHEIVNDQIGEQRFAVTYCPLAGSSFVFDTTNFPAGFGVSGRLFNSTLILYDRDSERLWPQMYAGLEPSLGTEWLDQLPFTQTTWRQWKALHPDTIVLSDDTGFSRNYNAYPYGDYRTNHSNTFSPLNPAADPQFDNKMLTYGLFDRSTGAARAYPMDVLFESFGDKGVFVDTFDGKELLFIWKGDTQLLQAFELPDSLSGKDFELQTRTSK